MRLLMDESVSSKLADLKDEGGFVKLLMDHGIQGSPDVVMEALSELFREGELSDEELENVAGGSPISNPLSTTLIPKLLRIKIVGKKKK